MKEKFERFTVVPYALIDVIHALHCNGITEIGVTKEDDDLVIFYDYSQIYKKDKFSAYGATGTVVFADEDGLKTYTYKRPSTEDNLTKPKFPG